MAIDSLPSRALEDDNSIALMARETRTVRGSVPTVLGDVPVAEGHWHITADALLLRAERGLSFLYRKGQGVVVDSPPGTDPRDVSLWLNGTVYAGIASINGLLPLHASAVAWQGQVYAFTGPSGIGKSTLIAALGKLGLPMFCDDTLVLDLSHPGEIFCLPGHKRLKLTPEALALTGAEALERVATYVDKHFARPPAGDVTVPLPLAELIFLEDGSEPAISPIQGAERLIRMQDDHYTAELYARARGLDRSGLFAHLARLAGAITTARFARPRDPACFHDGVALVRRYVTRAPSEAAGEAR